MYNFFWPVSYEVPNVSFHSSMREIHAEGIGRIYCPPTAKKFKPGLGNQHMITKNKEEL